MYFLRDNLIWLIMAGLLLVACGGLGNDEATPTPLPTSSLPGLVTVHPQLCQLIELTMLRVDRPHGDLLAWVPGGDSLAYVGPSIGSTWLVGTLMLVSGPDFANPQELADQVSGDLAWSPDGNGLAYLSLRRSDSLYSISVVYPQGGIERDLFPEETARTDAWSSQKAVIGWRDENHLRVQVSCGLDCVQTTDVNLADGSLVSVGTTNQRSWNWWDYTLYQPIELPAEYLDFMREVNFSPDGRRLVYLDPRSDAWVVSPTDGTQYPLNTGGFLAVSETDWSDDGRYLALQGEDRLFIFSTVCP